jgi:hypothetical protein
MFKVEYDDTKRRCKRKTKKKAERKTQRSTREKSSMELIAGLRH